MVWVVDNVFDMAELFTEIATTDPIAGALLAAGTLLFAVTFAIGGGLALGSLVDSVTPDSPGRAPPRERR